MQGHGNGDIVPTEDRFRYIDDLSILQKIGLTGLLTDYDFTQHVASDVGIDHAVPGTWQVLNTGYTQTRLQVNNIFIEMVPAMTILGVWVSKDLNGL